MSKTLSPGMYTVGMIYEYQIFLLFEDFKDLRGFLSLKSDISYEKRLVSSRYNCVLGCDWCSYDENHFILFFRGSAELSNRHVSLVLFFWERKCVSGENLSYVNESK